VKASGRPRAERSITIAPWICLLVLPAALLVLLGVGSRGFFRRAID